MQVTPIRPRALIARVFVSPGERRLRAGWRLLLHGALLLLLLLPAAAVFAVASAPLGLAPDSTTLLLTLDAGASLGAVLLATWLARRSLDRRSFGSLGFSVDRRTLPDLAFGFALPAVLMGLVFAAEWGLGWLHVEGWAWQSSPPGEVLTGSLGGLALWICVAIQEETLSRGYQLQNLADGLGLRWGVFLSSLIFAALHLPNPNAVALPTLLGLLAAGFFLAFAWVRTRRLWLSIGLHIGWNFFEGTVFGFPVSGLDLFRLLRQTVTGPALITGGAFGPEAGWLILPVLALGAALIAVYTRGRLGSAPASPANTSSPSV